MSKFLSLVAVRFVSSNFDVDEGWPAAVRIVTDQAFGRWGAAVLATKALGGLGCCSWTHNCVQVDWVLLLIWARMEWNFGLVFCLKLLLLGRSRVFKPKYEVGLSLARLGLYDSTNGLI